MKQTIAIALLSSVFCLTDSRLARSFPGELFTGSALRDSTFVQTDNESLIRTYGVKINVDDMDRALAFYCDKLGFGIEDRSGYPKHVVLKVSDGNKFILRRVRQLRKPNPTETQFSFTLQVNDLDQAIERMKSLGVQFGETGKRKEAVGSAIYIKDPFGRRISLMHQTIVKVEPFKEPRIYNFGFLIPDMNIARDFYGNKLGFVVRSEKYLPGDLPLGHKDKSFGFMLHYRPGVQALKNKYYGAPFNMLVFKTRNLRAAIDTLKKNGVGILTEKTIKSPAGEYVVFQDPFGNLSELLEVTK